MSLMDMLKQYASGAKPANENEVQQHFDQATQAVPQNVLSGGLAEAFRSNQTPAFGQMVANLFSQSNGQQKAGLLNHLLSSASPGLLSQIGGAGALSGLLSGGQQEVTAQQAQNISPETIQQLASHAEKADPSVVDRVSDFYSQHPQLVKTLGAAVLSVAMAKMANRQAA